MNSKNSSESRSQRAQNEARDSQGRFTSSSKGSGSKSSSSSSSRGSNSSSSNSRGSNSSSSSDGGRCRDEQGRFESCGTNNKK